MAFQFIWNFKSEILVLGTLSAPAEVLLVFSQDDRKLSGGLILITPLGAGTRLLSPWLEPPGNVDCQPVLI